MIVLNIVSMILVGNFAPHATSYNPLLTYTLRVRKIVAYPNISINYTIDQYREKHFINGHFTINSKQKINKVIGVFSRCNQEGFDCEYFQTWTVTDLCAKLEQDNQLWSSWYNSYYPPLSCPIDIMYYKIINGIIDVGPAVYIYPEMTNYYWKVSHKLYEDDIYVGGYSLEISVFGYRKKLRTV